MTDLAPNDQSEVGMPYSISPDNLRAIETLMAKYKIPGMCISVVRQIQGRWESSVTALGIRDFAGSPWLADSQHSIASCSKVFASVSIGLLIAQGIRLKNGERLAWNTKIKAILPEWEVMDKEVQENADIEDALSMRLGLPVNNAAWGFADDTPAAIVYRMRYHRPASAFRRSAIYSNASFILIGELVSQLSGMTYHDFVKRHILDPLGMTNTHFEHEKASASKRRVEGFIHYDQTGPGDVGELGQTRFWNHGDGLFLAAAGGAWTTGDDILLWLRESLDPQILPKALLDELNRPRTAFGPVQSSHRSSSQMFYGIGQHVDFYRGHRIVGHTGSLPGHYSFVYRLPDDNIALAIFCNDTTFGADALDTVYKMLLDDLLCIQERVDWEKVFMPPSLRNPSLPHQPLEYPRPSRDIRGTYTEGAYGTLCVVGIEDHPLGRVMSDLLETYPGNTIPLRPGAQIYLGDLAHDLRGSLLLSPVNGPIFTRAWIKAKEVQQVGGGQSCTAHITGVGRCVVTDHGIGMFEDFWGQGGAVGGLEIKSCTKKNVEKEAEVWFAKSGET